MRIPRGTRLCTPSAGEKASLSPTLLLLAHCAPLSTLPKAIRAVTTILEDEEARRTADTHVVAIMQKLDPILNLMDHAADMAKEA